MKHVAVVGASLAGLCAARALRSQGFDGALTIVGDEPHRPYDRPPLSKQLLAGTISVEDLALERADEELGAQWRLGVQARRLDRRGARITLSDGEELAVDGVVIATGASARRIREPGLTGVHVLRSVEDCLALRAELVPGVRLVVIGAGFIGAEVASTASSLGVQTTVVEVAPTPLSGPLGAEMGAVVAGLHTAHGVTLHCGVPVSQILGADRVTGVALGDGRILAADVVVVGVGAEPNVAWLRGSGLALGRGVHCSGVGVSRVGASDLPQVVAVGDCAAWFDADTGSYRRTEHWTAAVDRAAIAVAALLGGGAGEREPSRQRAPYFWSDQYGITIQFAGHALPDDSVRVEVGETDQGSFLAVYRRGGEPVAVLGVDQVREFARWRRQVA
jgi:NADPH-dependent 2,4-dienoyl-CoA reductase/sulfur reductase-like enzyme